MPVSAQTENPFLGHIAKTAICWDISDSNCLVTSWHISVHQISQRSWHTLSAFIQECIAYLSHVGTKCRKTLALWVQIENFILSLLDLLLLLHEITLARKKKKKSWKTPMCQYFQTMWCAAPLVQATAGNCLSNCLIMGECTVSEGKIRSCFIKWVPVFFPNILKIRQTKRLALYLCIIWPTWYWPILLCHCAK